MALLQDYWIVIAIGVAVIAALAILIGISPATRIAISSVYAARRANEPYRYQ